MFSLLLFLGGIALAAFVGYVIYREDVYHKRDVPFDELSPLKISLFEWLSRGYHWHSFGHFFMDFAITLAIGTGFVSFLTFLISTFDKPTDLIDSFTASLLAALAYHPVVVAFVCMIPSFLLTLYIELVADKHYRSFVPRTGTKIFSWNPLKLIRNAWRSFRSGGTDGGWESTRDFLFDLFTHWSGGVLAVLIMLSLYAAVQGLVPAVGYLVPWGLP